MNITFYTGSGVSQESGVPTFRDPNGLWETFDAGVVSSVDGWKKKPQEFMEFWDIIRGQFKQSAFKPNEAHKLIAQWEYETNHRGDEFNLITTNVDNLHELAGSKDPIKVHGDLLTQGRTIELDAGGGYVQSWTMPDIVLFGDGKKRQKDMWKAIATADLFVVVGSSLSIGGDVSIVYNAKDQGAKTVEINPNLTGHSAFDLTIPKVATEGVRDLYTLMSAA